MTVRIDEIEEKRLEELTREAELLVEIDDTKKDLKEKRGIIKENLYNGPKKLKHVVPKGKRI
jgi:hypothetical protein